MSEEEERYFADINFMSKEDHDKIEAEYIHALLSKYGYEENECELADNDDQIYTLWMPENEYTPIENFFQEIANHYNIGIEVGIGCQTNEEAKTFDYLSINPED